MPGGRSGRGVVRRWPAVASLLGPSAPPTGRTGPPHRMRHVPAASRLSLPGGLFQAPRALHTRSPQATQGGDTMGTEEHAAGGARGDPKEIDTFGPERYVVGLREIDKTQ